jgi:hypothetical protein
MKYCIVSAFVWLYPANWASLSKFETYLSMNGQSILRFFSPTCRVSHGYGVYHGFECVVSTGTGYGVSNVYTM